MQIDWWSLGIQTINFAIVVWLLTRFLFQPVRRMVDEREATERKALEQATAKTETAENARLEYERLLADLDHQRQQQEAALQREMEKQRELVLSAARKKADTLLADARARRVVEREEALAELKDEIVALAVDLARKALSASGAAQSAPERAREYFERMPRRDLEELRTDAAATGIAIVTAVLLDDCARATWRSTLCDRLGDGIAIDFRVDPTLIGGAAIHFPHAVLDLSVAQGLRDAASALAEQP